MRGYNSDRAAGMTETGPVRAVKMGGGEIIAIRAADMGENKT